MLILENNRSVLAVVTIAILVGQFAELGNSNLLLLLSILFVSLYAMFCDITQLAGLMLLLVAPNRLLTYGPISAPAIVMFIGSIRFLGITKSNLKIDAIISGFLLILVSVATVINGDSQFISVVKLLVVLYFVRSSFVSVCVNDRYVQLVELCSIGCLLTSLITFSLNPSALLESTRFSLTGSGGENVLGILSAVMFLNLLNIILYKSDRRKIEHIFFSLGLILICLFTGSRSAVLCLVAGLACFFILSCFKLNFKQVLVILLCAGLLLLLFYNLMQTDNLISQYVQNFLYRFQKLEGKDVSNGRYELWNMYVDIFRENPSILWLGGLDIFSFGLPLVAHNMIIEQIANHGILGSIIILFLYIGVYRDVALMSNSKVKIFSTGVAPIIALLVASMFSHTLLGIPQTVMLFISAYGLLEAKI